MQSTATFLFWSPSSIKAMDCPHGATIEHVRTSAHVVATVNAVFCHPKAYISMRLVSDFVLVGNMLQLQEDERKCQALTLSKNAASKNTPVSAFWKMVRIMHCSVDTEIPLHPPFTRPLISPIPARVNARTCQCLSGTVPAGGASQAANIHAPEDMDRVVCCITQLLSIKPLLHH